jgi:hypothetical protein
MPPSPPPPVVPPPVVPPPVVLVAGWLRPPVLLQAHIIINRTARIGAA